MTILYYLLVVAALSASKGFWDASTPRTPWDLPHIVSRAGLALACVWGVFLTPPWWAIIPAAVVGWAAFRLGSGAKWDSIWTRWLRRKPVSRLP